MNTKDLTYESCKYIVTEAVKLAQEILDGEESSLYELSSKNEDDSYFYRMKLKKNRNPESLLFSTGKYFTEYLKDINKNKIEAHYFAFGDEDVIIVSLRRNYDGSFDSVEYEAHNVFEEEDWFQYSTLYDNQVLLALMFFSAFKRANLPPCLLELEEFFKYLEQKELLNESTS